MPDATRLALANALTSHEAAALKLREDIAARAGETSRQKALSTFATLPEPRKRRAEARALIARLCDEFLATSGLPRRRGTELFATDYNDGRVAVPDWTRETVPSLCAGSIRNWQKALDREGLARLAGNQGRHRLGTGKIDGNPAMDGLISETNKEHQILAVQTDVNSLRSRFDDLVFAYYGVREHGAPAVNRRATAGSMSPCRARLKPI